MSNCDGCVALAAPSIQSDIMDLSLNDLAASLRSGALSSRRLVTECLEKIELENGRLRAFVDVFEREALATAKALDAQAANGDATGALHGVPIAIKDLIDVKGSVTGFGSNVYRHELATSDAVVVRRLRAAGAVIIGKTQMTEFAFDGRGINGAIGTPWNPWDRATHRIPGGSSSGSAVAVAAGLVPAALGSDTSGSIRMPAALCGISGFKPPGGAIPRSGAAVLSDSFDSLGPMARGVADVHLLYQVAAAFQGSFDPSPHRSPIVALANVGEWQDLSTDVAAIMDDALSVVRKLGIHPSAFDLPLSLQAYFDLADMIIGSEAFAQLRHIIQNESIELDAVLRQKLIEGNTLDRPGLMRAYLRREEETVRFSRALGGIDVLLLPAVATTAMPLQTVVNMNLRLSKFMRPASYLDLSALVIPIGLTRDGLPVGLQLMCGAGREERMFQLAMQVEAAIGFDGRRALSQHQCSMKG